MKDKETEKKEERLCVECQKPLDDDSILYDFNTCSDCTDREVRIYDLEDAHEWK